MMPCASPNIEEGYVLRPLLRDLDLLRDNVPQDKTNFSIQGVHGRCTRME